MSLDMEEPIGLEQKVEKIYGWSEDRTLAMNIVAWSQRNRREEKELKRKKATGEKKEPEGREGVEEKENRLH